MPSIAVCPSTHAPKRMGPKKLLPHAHMRPMRPTQVEEVEDLLEYYLQRTSATQSEAERLLQGGLGGGRGQI